MPERSKDWLAQAERDLERCVLDIKYEFYEWACFTAQQAAEKAVKALIYSLKGLSWGHSITNLLREISSKLEIPEEIIEDAQLLDAYYIPTRYPNGWPSGVPKDFFNLKKAEEAYGAAKRILAFCRREISGQK